jgi:hypothetical protein
MKLIVLTAVASYDKDIMQLLKSNKIPQFSYQKVVGYRDSTLEGVSSNWFASEMNESESTLFFAFVPESSVDPLLQAVDQFNDELKAESKVHLFVSPIEKHSKL